MASRRELSQLKLRVRLETEVEKVIGRPVRVSRQRLFFNCPKGHDVDSPSFVVSLDYQTYKCFGCGIQGDVIDWWQWQEGLDIPEIRKRLEAMGPLPPDVKRSRETARKPKRARGDPPPDAWQTRARFYVEKSSDVLWSPRGKQALAYLREIRGLNDETIRDFDLGYNPTGQHFRPVTAWGLTKGKAVYFSRGIVIPCEVQGAIWYVQVRRPTAGDSLHRYIGDPLASWQPKVKYWTLRGSGKAIFGLDNVQAQPTAMICESEFDAMLLSQQAGDLVDVVAIGGAGSRPDPLTLWPLARAGRWFVVLDRDQFTKLQEQGNVSWWDDFSARVRVVHPPEGNDVGDFHQMGGNLRAWVTFLLERDLWDRGSPLADLAPLVGRVFTLEDLQVDAAARLDALHAEAEGLLEDLEAPQARRRYAEIAQELDWPCYGASWEDWIANSETVTSQKGR